MAGIDIRDLIGVAAKESRAAMTGGTEAAASSGALRHEIKRRARISPVILSGIVRATEIALVVVTGVPVQLASSGP